MRKRRFTKEQIIKVLKRGMTWPLSMMNANPI